MKHFIFGLGLPTRVKLCCNGQTPNFFWRRHGPLVHSIPCLAPLTHSSTFQSSPSSFALLTATSLFISLPLSCLYPSSSLFLFISSSFNSRLFPGFLLLFSPFSPCFSSSPF